MERKRAGPSTWHARRALDHLVIYDGSPRLTYTHTHTQAAENDNKKGRLGSDKRVQSSGRHTTLCATVLSCQNKGSVLAASL